jgi:glycerol-3-phosphate dehydrogenase
MAYEFARNAEEVVWRRSKLGQRLSQEEIEALDRWMADCFAEGSPSRQGATSH